MVALQALLGVASVLDGHDARWMNEHGGPIVDLGDPIARLVGGGPPSAPFSSNHASALHDSVPPYTYSRADGYLAAGNDLAVLNVTSVQEALDACTVSVECRGVTYAAGVNGTITNVTKVFLKKSTARAGGVPWSSWFKAAPVEPPAKVLDVGDLRLALRAGTFTVQNLTATRAGVDNFSFVPALSGGNAIPLVQHLGDVTLRVRPAEVANERVSIRSKATQSEELSEAGWDFFASAWGPFSAEASPETLRPGELAAHDITALLEATRVPGASRHAASCPIRVRRAFRRPASGPGVEMAFELLNPGEAAIEIGGLGLSMPSAVSQDVHIGGGHGWVEWIRVHVNDQLHEDQQCVIATPLNSTAAASGESSSDTPDASISASASAAPFTRFEAWRPIFEFGGGGDEWSVHTAAWASEWASNTQWPYLYMADILNETGIWPRPRSPWPSWAAGGQTVRTNFSRDATPWHAPTSRVLAPGQSATYGVRLSACPGGPRTRDAALEAVGEPILKGVPGYTLATDMKTAVLYVTPAAGVRVVGAAASNESILTVGAPRAPLACGAVAVPVRGITRGRSRLEVTLSDGSVAVAHYLVLPPLPSQIGAVAKHWSEVAWLPRDYPDDPFGRGAAVLPYDREDRRIRLNDARAYDVGLSDDAGAANNLGLASSMMFAPSQKPLSRLDEYIKHTLYGVKPDTAAAPLKSLQLPEPNNGIRMTMFYYNQTYFAWNYTESAECEVKAHLNYCWCMTESQANATYRGFNYPHQIAVWYAMYRAARNHPHLQVEHPWEWYLARAANTTIRLGYARIGYMDGTVTREVLRSVLEEAEEAAPTASVDAPSLWDVLGQQILAGEKGRADFFVTAPNPYGSEFAYDTTGQEEVVVWLLFFDHDDAASRTVDHVLQYMRSLPNWAYHGGAVAGDVANGGKWFVSAGTGRGDYGKMHCAWQGIE